MLSFIKKLFGFGTTEPVQQPAEVVAPYKVETPIQQAAVQPTAKKPARRRRAPKPAQPAEVKVAPVETPNQPRRRGRKPKQQS